jgi:low affinity Fe/Cu permease
MKTTLAQKHPFEKLSSAVTKSVGSTPAFIIALSVVIVWLITGPVFHYSNSWQLVINTATTIVTFIMVFLIQRSQNKESLAIQIKLNELIASSRLASNRLIDIEDLTEDELGTLEKYYGELVKMSKKDKTMQQSHTIEEASALHQAKIKTPKKIKARYLKASKRSPQESIDNKTS